MDIEGVRVLLVEDHPDTLDTIATLLRQAGATVEALPSAQEAFDSYQASPPDILVCDLILHGASGFSLMRRIRAARVGPYLPAIAVTGQHRADVRDEARDAGFDAFLSKPILADDLVRTVRGLLGK
jgi:CheY-like chemotaxis protein